MGLAIRIRPIDAVGGADNAIADGHKLAVVVSYSSKCDLSWGRMAHYPSIQWVSPAVCGTGQENQQRANSKVSGSGKRIHLE
jgi:hypothetical protein